MSTFKRTKVVMLPTKEKAPLWFYSYSDNKTPHPQLSKGVTLGIGDKYAHLYFLSDDEIKEGDWYYWSVTKTVGQFKKENLIREPRETDSNTRFKIIATTDKSLKTGVCGNCTKDNCYEKHFERCMSTLPEPSQGFIKKYCEKGGIDEVMVEYEKLIIPLAKNWNDSLPVIKVSSDNTITIKPIKDSWNREEVMELCNRYQTSLYNKFPEIASAIDTVKAYEDLPKHWEEWFKENL